MRQVLYFGAEWCGPCKYKKPLVQELQSQMSVVFIDVDVSYQSAQTWNVKSVPTVLIIENAREVGRLVGEAITKQSVINLYNK
jgi:thiol-disulfide isomerase/thioredoxin